MVNRRDFIKTSSAVTLGMVAMPSVSLYTKGGQGGTGKPGEARFIWYAPESKGRNLHACFRKTFVLKSTVRKAVLCLFADTTYRLYVNGRFVHYGPVRFDPRYPLYDACDISSYLVPGENVIAVAVNYYGMKTYKSIPAAGAFVAWGEVETANEKISLHTSKHTWKAVPFRAYAKFASKISFALHARDIYDQALEENGWQTVDFDDSHWPQACELANQNQWGPLSSRYIPSLEGTPLVIPSVRHVLPLVQFEDIYSFTVPVPDFYDDDAVSRGVYIPFSTWIFSPEDQTVTVGSFYGEKWLNGELLPRGYESHTRNMRINQLWTLRKGWNYFFGKVGTYTDAIDVYFAFPAGRGIVLAADQKMDSAYSFRYAAVLDKKLFDQTLGQRQLPYEPDDMLADAGGWQWVKKSDSAWSPGRDTSWDEYGQQVESIDAEKLAGHVFRKSVYPHGFSILLDLGYMRLAIPEIVMEGVRDAVIDITYSEHLCEDGQHLKQSFNYNGADRIYCSRPEIAWMASNPRGMRYLMITVRRNRSDVTFKSLRLYSMHYPVEWKGSLHTSDALLNAIWQMCALTQSCNMTDAYVDCCGREQGMYIRDTVIQYHNNLAVFGDHLLMKRCLELYGQSPDATGKFRAVYPNTGDYTIADFSLNMIEGYYAYYLHTGDRETIARDWQAMQRNLDWFHRLADERDDLLLDAEWDKKRGIKAHYGGFHGDLQIKEGYMDNRGIHCVFSCTYLIALRCAEMLAKAIGKTNDAASLRRRIDILTNSIQKFYDPQKKTFADNLAFTTYSHHAALFAVRAGVAHPDQMEGIREHVSRELQSIFVNGYDPSDGCLTSPSFAFYIFEGLYQLGLAKIAEDMMRTGWGWFLFKGCKTTPEYFTLASSLCHAWSASPVYFLSKHVLGIHFPAAPDLDTVEIRVHTHYVKQAEGKWPHPKGLIEVKWHLDNEGQRRFDYVRTPAGVRAVIVE